LPALGRFFERLQQRVERFLRELVDLVDDVNLEPRSARPHVDILPQLANVVDVSVARPVDFDHIHVVAGGDRLADVADVARLGRRAVLAIKGFSEDSSGRGFSDPPSAGEQIGMTDAVRLNCASEPAADVLLADQLRKRLRPISPSDDHIFARPALGSPIVQRSFGVVACGHAQCRTEFIPFLVQRNSFR
jgi:hypothetical protein